MNDPAFQPLAPHIVDFDPAIHDDIENVELANLPTKYTGVEGTMYISTRQARHGPRTKWFPGRAGDVPCLAIVTSDPPTVLNLGLTTRELNRGSGPAERWTMLNADALLEFWHVGNTWDRDEVNALIDRLQKLP